MREGLCENFGACELANNRERQRIEDGGAFACRNPACGKPLQEGVGDGGDRRKWPLPLVLGGAAFLACAAALGGWFVLRPAQLPVDNKPKIASDRPIGAAPSDGGKRDVSQPPTIPAVVQQIQAKPSETVPPPPSRERILRLAGSNTIGAELAPALVKEFLLSRGAAHIERRQMGDGEYAISADMDGKPVEATITAHGSATGFKALADGSADIADSSRPISPKEEQQLQAAGIGRDVGSEYVIGMDGIAIIANKSNPVGTLTIEQLARLFAGEAKWKDVGGPESCQDVGIYARDENSGTWELFNLFVLRGGQKSRVLSPSATRFEDSQLLSDRVATDPCGIGFDGLPYVAGNRLLAIQAVNRAYQPTLYTIRTEIYPLSRRLFMYTPKFSRNIEVSRFLQFVASTAGKHIVQEIGFISDEVTPPQHEDIPPLDPRYPKLFTLLGPHEPLSTTILFRTGIDSLDSKAYADLTAIEQMFRQRGLPPRSLVLIGHADSSGSHAMNCELSQRRAAVVERELTKLGLFATDVKGFCDDVPVASNDTDEGRQKNRRVELWIPTHL